jgi:hypothetical protein
VGSATNVGATVGDTEAEEDSEVLEEAEVAESAEEVSTVADDPAFLTKRFGNAIAGLAAAFASLSIRHSMLVAQRFCRPPQGAASTVDTKDRSMREPLTSIIMEGIEFARVGWGGSELAGPESWIQDGVRGKTQEAPI